MSSQRLMFNDVVYYQKFWKVMCSVNTTFMVKNTWLILRKEAAPSFAMGKAQ